LRPRQVRRRVDLAEGNRPADVRSTLCGCPTLTPPACQPPNALRTTAREGAGPWVWRIPGNDRPAGKDLLCRRRGTPLDRCDRQCQQPWPHARLPRGDKRRDPANPRSLRQRRHPDASACWRRWAIASCTRSEARKDGKATISLGAASYAFDRRKSSASCRYLGVPSAPLRSTRHSPPIWIETWVLCR
jgi:hypothetical protein